MSNGSDEREVLPVFKRASKRELIPASPGPQIAQRESDREEMLGALERTKARAAGMAHQTAEREMRKQARRSGRR